jgi:hypothetical protein
MSESPTPPLKRFWPPPEAPEVRKEQTKLTATLVNALAIACTITGFVGPLITSIPDSDLTFPTRAGLVAMGLALHLAARWILRYM